jgi:hypothetical protein
MTIKGKPMLTLALLALAGVMFYGTARLSPVARLVPLIVLVATVALLLAELVLDLSPEFVRRHSALETKDVFGIEGVRKKAREGVAPPGSSLGGQEVNLCIWLFGLLGLIYLVGLLIALPLFTLLYLRQRSGERWRLSITVAIGMFAVLLGVLVGLGQTPLSDGWLWTTLVL